MVDESTAPGRRRLPRWARVLLCVALVAVLVLQALVVIALWPGLNFGLEASAESEASRGWGISRVTQRDPFAFKTLLRVRFGIGELYWFQRAPGWTTRVAGPSGFPEFLWESDSLNLGLAVQYR